MAQHYASISYSFYPPWSGSLSNFNAAEADSIYQVSFDDPHPCKCEWRESESESEVGLIDHFSIHAIFHTAMLQCNGAQIKE